jgi:hypothetical protein
MIGHSAIFFFCHHPVANEFAARLPNLSWLFNSGNCTRNLANRSKSSKQEKRYMEQSLTEEIEAFQQGVGVKLNPKINVLDPTEGAGAKGCPYLTAHP